MKKYKLQEIIGDGTYGRVWKGTLIETGDLVAIKKLKNKIKSWQECMELKEVKVLSKLKSHPNIIKLKEIIRETNSEVFMIFEYAEMNLFQYMEKTKKRGETIPESKIKEIIFQITNGIQYTHQNGYFHRDIKPENILIMNEHAKTGEDYIKIADFGLARELPSYYNSIQLTDYVCTRWYRAPECILKSTNYSSPMDIWSIGCVMAELYLMTPLFPGTSEIDQLMKVANLLGSPKFNEWPEGFKLIQKMGIKFPITTGVNLSNVIPNASVEALNLLNELLNWDGLSRPNCAKILANPYFDEIRLNPNQKSKFSSPSGIYSNSSNSVNSYPNAKNFFYNNAIKNQNHNSTNSLINNTYLQQNHQNILNTQTTENSKISNNYNNYYINTDSYLNNFNFKNYRNNNNIIPDVNTHNSNLNHLFFNNLNQNTNTHKSKLSSLAEKDLNFNFNKYNNNKFNLNSNNFPINNFYDQITTISGNQNIYDFPEEIKNNNYNDYNSSKNVTNFVNSEFVGKNYNPKEKENLLNLNSYQTAFYPY